MRAPAVSIVIGAYNAQRYLGQTLDTLLAQTFSDFELIVANDGSTDRTGAILDAYAHKDSRVKPVTIPHGGIVAAANAALAVAQAPLIARADADDLYPPDRLQKQVDYLAAHPEVVALGGRAMMIEPYGSPLRETDQPLDHDAIEACLLKGDGGALMQPTAMLRRSAIDAAGAYRDKYPWSEDLDLFLRMAEVGKLANLPDILVRYRIHSGSTNWKKHGIQRGNKPELIAEHYARRGRTPPAQLPPQNPWEPPAQRYRFWVWCALKNKNVYAARRHALTALKYAPFSTQTWRAAYCALRGH